MALTENDKKLLSIFSRNGGKLTSNPSTIGFELYPNGRESRTAQGMALAGGKAISRLIKAGLVNAKSDSKFFTVYRLTDSAEKYLAYQDIQDIQESQEQLLLGPRGGNNEQTNTN